MFLMVCGILGFILLYPLLCGIHLFEIFNITLILFCMEQNVKLRNQAIQC